MRIATASILYALAVVGVDSQPTEDCPLLGPSFPSSFDIEGTSAFQDAVSSFPAVIETLFEAGRVNRTHSSFALDVFSADTGRSIYSYFHNAPALEGQATRGAIDDETIFRIGSVSKLVTAYALLAKAGLEIFDHPVTKYLPELAGSGENDPVDRIIWDDVTIGALASQQAGTGGPPIEFIECAITNPPSCVEQEYFEYLRTMRTPVMAVHQTAIYSDGGWMILGFVMGRLTGVPFNEALGQLLREPLGLNSTTTVQPTEEGRNAFIVPGDFSVSSWGLDAGFTPPSGGVYSNLADLRRIGSSILNSEIISPANTRAWMKPLAHTGSVTTSVGAPWEILRLPLPVSVNSTRTRISDLYTKAGGNNGYGAVLGLSPDHRIGFNILVAGPAALSERFPLSYAIATAFITAAEHAAAEHAASQYTGTFVDDANEGTNLTLTVDADRPGLGMPAMFVDGVEVREQIFGPGTVLGLPAANLSVRLYPTGLESGCAPGYGNAGVTRLTFRAVPQRLPNDAPRSAVEGGNGLFDIACNAAWGSIGFFETDGFVLEVEDGKLHRITNNFVNRTMTRIA